MIDKIKGFLSLIFSPILAIYNRLVAKLYQADDRQRRVYQYKVETMDINSPIGRFFRFYWKLNSFITPKRFTLREQKDLAGIVRMAIKFGNENILPFREMSIRTDLRHFVRQQTKEIADELQSADLYKILETRKVFHREYVALIEVAYRTGNFVEAYDKIINSLDDKIKRRNAYIMLMIVPIFTVIVGLLCEIFAALFIIPEVLNMVDNIEQMPPVTTSYYNLREILLNDKTEWFIKLSLIGSAIVLFTRIEATKYLIDLFLVQIPIASKLIARWEISKFFNCINDMVKSNASIQEATTISIGLINNRAIKNSIWKDIATKRQKTSQLSELLEDSVHIEQRIRNQLRIATVTNSRIDQLLDTIVEDYKESMNILMDAPMKVVMPATLVVGAIYIFIRLVPLFNEVNIMLQNIGT